MLKLKKPSFLLSSNRRAGNLVTSHNICRFHVCSLPGVQELLPNCTISQAVTEELVANTATVEPLSYYRGCI